MKCSTSRFNYTLERTGDLISINWLECLVLADTAATPRVGPTSPRSSVHEIGRKPLGHEHSDDMDHDRDKKCAGVPVVDGPKC
jgi:hypothetical protein